MELILCGLNGMSVLMCGRESEGQGSVERYRTLGTKWWQFTFHTLADRASHSRSGSREAGSSKSGTYREALVDSRLIVRWSRMPNWSSNASRETALPGRSLCVATRVAYSTSVTGSPATERKPKTCRRMCSSACTGHWEVTGRRTVDLQPG